MKIKDIQNMVEMDEKKGKKDKKSPSKAKSKSKRASPARQSWN